MRFSNEIYECIKVILVNLKILKFQINFNEFSINKFINVYNIYFNFKIINSYGKNDKINTNYAINIINAIKVASWDISTL